MNYSKRCNRCKLKDELIIIKRQSCNKFHKVPQKLINLDKRRDKNRQKVKLAKNCIKCPHIDNGWCNLHKEWGSLVVNKCEFKGNNVLIITP
jgi:hypothetical protein